jgi:hypothetical protein
LGLAAGDPPTTSGPAAFIPVIMKAVQPATKIVIGTDRISDCITYFDDGNFVNQKLQYFTKR